MKTLIIEDSERLGRSLEVGLRRLGFSVDVVADGREGLEYARYGGYDAIVLDLMLPKLDGLSVLRQLRVEQNPVHVLILSARDQVAHRIEGLRLGADDYLVKPFDFDELVARLRALIRRKYAAKNPVHKVGDLELDTAARSAICAEREIELSAREYAVLEHLVLKRGQVVSKTELLERLYTDASCGTDNTVEVFVHQLRKKLAPAAGAVIRTKRGHGYMIE
ncbi:MAG: response regulator transcription factor [Planctomycetes bacterium]|nr:response regulator transcription factor [Planctomycetota bacterium]